MRNIHNLERFVSIFFKGSTEKRCVHMENAKWKNLYGNILEGI